MAYYTIERYYLTGGRGHQGNWKPTCQTREPLVSILEYIMGQVSRRIPKLRVITSGTIIGTASHNDDGSIVLTLTERWALSLLKNINKDGELIKNFANVGIGDNSPKCVKCRAEASALLKIE